MESGLMLRSNIRTATFIILSTALATTTAGAQPSKGGFALPAVPGPVPHVAPAPQIPAAPAPHIFVAPQISTPRVAPQISAPPVMSAPRVVPQQFGHPYGGASSGAVTRPVETPRVLAVPRQEKQ